jgi:glutathionylspermidine synthase
MKFVSLPERPDWKSQAEEAGFTFHSMHGQPYWMEDGAYAFTLEEIENRIEDPATELHQMCREAVAKVVGSEELMRRFDIPEEHRDLVAESWHAGEQELYGRFDFIYDGNGPAKMIEYNADTPTSLYEASTFQWVWLEQQIERGVLPKGTDQFNSIFEAIRDRFAEMFPQGTDIHFTSLGSAEENYEDYATVETMAYAAREAGMGAHYTEMSAIGLTEEGQFADADSRVIGSLFKLYPWEDMLRDPFAAEIRTSQCRFIEPAWKAIVSNKAILAVLWEMFEGHDNLLPSFFDHDVQANTAAVQRAVDKGLFARGQVRKPIFSREGASVTITGPDDAIIESASNREYDQHASIIQAYHPMPQFRGYHPVLGVWVAGTEACGLGVREDKSLITQDLSIFRPHFIEA